MDKYKGFIGKILDGRYKILDLVGVGGMAVVLKAEDLVMDRVVAIKILNDQYNGDEQAEIRFINESKAVAMLSNKNIVGVYDVAIFPDIKYIVMEYLDGITLREYMDNKKLLPWKEACVYVLQILRALEHAHGKDVVHRDIKPQNIILLKNGEVKVTDFGIAKTPDMTDIPVTDKAIGTVYYISPEQASGKETSFASDIYSVGVVLYELVTGELPFTADSPVTVAMMQINDIPKPPLDINPSLPPGVSQIILKAMSKRIEDRFKDSHSMLKAVDYVIKNPGVVFSDGKEKPAEKDEIGDLLDFDGKHGEKVDFNMISTGEIGDYVINIGENAAPDENKSPNTGNRKGKGKGKGNAKNTSAKESKAKSSDKIKKSRQRRKERPSHSVFPIISGVFFAFMIVLLGFAGYLAIKWVPSLFETEKPKDFFVRDLTDLKYTSELRKELEEQGYIISVTEVYRQGMGFDVIVDQDPATGNKRTSDGKCRITLLINKYPDDLVVPDIKYMTPSEAEKILKQYNLYAVTVYITDRYANDKQIVYTSPEIGSFVEAGTTVTLYVCKDIEITEAKTLPNVVGKTVAKATEELENAYYLVTVTYENSSKPDGQVLAQDIPAFTTGLSPWTMVTLTVSHKTDYILVENYIGLTLEAAKSKITSAGFKVGGVIYETSSKPKNTVISQSVAADTSSAAGTVIDLVLSGEGVGIASPVPDVRGKTLSAASEALTRAGYVVEVVKQPSEESSDKVLSQSLTPEKSGYPRGTKIVLTVSVAKDYVKTSDLKGYTFPQALKYIYETRLSLGEVLFTSDAPAQTSPYTVVAQTIGGGTYVPPDTKVGVTLYGEPRYAEPVPNVMGMTESGAVKALCDAWYTVQVVYERTRDIDGAVIKQNTPFGTTDLPPGSKVVITVCVAETTAEVPDFTGKTLGEVVDILYELNLELGEVSYKSSDKKEDTVIEQSPIAGTEVPFGTFVDITLSGEGD